MSTHNETFLYRYLNNTSPVGYEASGQAIWLDYIRPYVDKTFTDTYGTAVGVINPEAEYKVVIEAHADEISWYVNYITKDGYIYLIRNGGSDYHIAPSMRAKIHAEKGDIPAVIGWPAIHVRDPKKQPVPGPETVVLDAGFASDKEAAKRGVRVGSVVTFDQQLCELNDNFWVGRALDNRIGGYVIAQVARSLHEQSIKLPFSLYIVNAVQEEIGFQGAHMISHTIKPDLVLVTDVTHDTQSPLYNKKKDGDVACGKGPALVHAPSVQRNLCRMLTQVAERHKIPYQLSASSRGTHTDADSFAYANGGTPTAVISPPLKYMHTTVEMVHKQDVHHVTTWMQHFLEELTPHHNFSYFA